MHNNGRDHVVYNLVQRNKKLRHPRPMKREFWSKVVAYFENEMSYSIIMPFSVNLYHDGVFVERPLEYTNGDFKVIDDVDFDGMLYVQMFDIIRRITPKKQAVKTLFKCNVDDASRTYENLEDLKDIVDFKVKGEENVVMPKNSTDDPWLKKLVSQRNFIGHTDDPMANLGIRLYTQVDTERPVPRSKLHKPYDNPSPLPPIERKKHGRPRKQKIRHLTEDDNQSQTVPNLAVDQSKTTTGKPSQIPNNIGTIRIGSPIKRGEDNQMTEGGGIGDGYFTTKEYQHKMDMIALAEDNELNVHQVSMDLPVNEALEHYTTEES
nr:hypothetical protein [Tanacetum cinerariifolium]